MHSQRNVGCRSLGPYRDGEGVAVVAVSLCQPKAEAVDRTLSGEVVVILCAALLARKQVVNDHSSQIQGVVEGCPARSGMDSR